jgi:hypothetical protein
LGEGHALFDHCCVFDCFGISRDARISGEFRRRVRRRIGSENLSERAGLGQEEKEMRSEELADISR